MADSVPGQLSKSARKRANQKARAAAEEAIDSAPAPVVAAPASGYPAGTQPKAKAKADAKAKAQAEPKAKAEAKPDQNAGAKAKAKAEPAQPKKQAQAKAKPVAKDLTEEEIQKKKEDVHDFSAFDQFDDGSGAAWEVSTGKTSKQQKREERIAEQKQLQQAQQAQGSTGGKHIPGLTPIIPGQHIPGMAPQSVNAASKVSQNVNATAIIAQDPKKEEPKADVASCSATLKVPEERIGVVIGPKGRNIKLIQEKTQCTRIDTTGTEFTITGNAKSVEEAKMAIESLIEKGYTALQYDDFQEHYVMVLDKKLPDVIGKKGAVILKLKEALGVEVSIPKNVVPGKKCKVTIAGQTHNCEKAKEAIESIVQWGHHEITHPGEIHEEVEVPSWAYAWIIGTKGSELRHIQNNYKVKVSIPRDQKEDSNVVVVGLKEDVPRAVAYIWKVLDGAKDASKGRNRTDVAATDEWGDEGPEEEWMSQYMYKRR